MTTDPLPEFFTATNIMLLVGILVLFFLSALSTFFYRAMEELNRSDYSEIKSKGTTYSSIIVRLLDKEDTTMTALEFSALIFRGFSLFPKNKNILT